MTCLPYLKTKRSSACFIGVDSCASSLSGIHVLQITGEADVLEALKSGLRQLVLVDREELF